jgi:anaerobic magnesium-protoporphyrin IX monomethyl ester cyclase
MPDRPYISLPTLVGYLQARNIPVHALDLNIALYHAMLSPENLRASFEFGIDRLSVLNDRRELNLGEIIEFLRLVRILGKVNVSMEEICSLFVSEHLTCDKKNHYFPMALQLASLPFFPEWLDLTENTNYIRYHSRFSNYSSADLISSLQYKLLFSEVLERVMTASIEHLRPSIIGISVIFADQVQPALLCARLSKKMFPQAFVVLGGTFVTTHLQETTNAAIFESIDAMVIGEGEVPLEVLYNEVASGRKQISKVPNAIYLAAGNVHKTGRVAFDHETISCKPDYTVFPLDRYMYREEEIALMFRICRGCYWGKCAFCNSMETGFQQPQAERVYRDLKAMVEETGVRLIHFTDDAVPLKLLDHISARLLEDEIKLLWGCNLRFEKGLTLDRLMKYAQAGCYTIYFGLESAHPRILALMNKGIELESVDRVLNDLTWAGIKAYLYMIVGFPTETEEEALTSFEKVKELIQQGLIAGCIYNRFEISSPSPVSRNLERFSITRLHADNSKDLRPPIANFECSGMSRETAIRLMHSFLNYLNMQFGKTAEEQPQSTKDLTLGGRVFPLNFDVARMRSVAQETLAGRSERLAKAIEKVGTSVRITR